ncbi:hypothetical protein WN51_06528 [Melipona quadrifasciata]|uniref:Uncharacterized protein n=1 Tax=Melipona quadrifasciata TaxID=166423 RepID=A0A0M8ZT78_9HYME|nr:hypothetical protein WN51_06528 [Melipona quadrifasciata]
MAPWVIALRSVESRPVYRHEAETHHLPLRTRRGNVAVACAGDGGGGGGGGLYHLGFLERFERVQKFYLASILISDKNFRLTAERRMLSSKDKHDKKTEDILLTSYRQDNRSNRRMEYIENIKISFDTETPFNHRFEITNYVFHVTTKSRLYPVCPVPLCSNNYEQDRCALAMVRAMTSSGAHENELKQKLANLLETIGHGSPLVGGAYNAQKGMNSWRSAWQIGEFKTQEARDSSLDNLRNVKLRDISLHERDVFISAFENERSKILLLRLDVTTAVTTA